MADTLKPCPFCGGDEISHGFNDPPPSPDLYGIAQCHTCNAFMLGDGEAEAIAAWNTRTRDDGEGVALREALASIAEGNLGDASWQANYDRIREVARKALAPKARSE